MPGAACNSRELTDRVRAWFAALPEPATVIFDFKTDWHLLAVAMLAAAVVLVSSDRTKLRAAAIQGTLPLIGLVLLAVRALQG